jgi:hypothetical protein
MGTRLQLQTLLEGLLPAGKKAWFQPPASVELTYPTIIYSHDDNYVIHSNNFPYAIEKRYQVTVIDEDPDSQLVDKLAAFPKCAMSRKFTADELNHTIFDLYF